MYQQGREVQVGLIEDEDEIYEINVPELHHENSNYSSPPILTYSYSGISNVSSNNDLSLKQSRMSSQYRQSINFLKPGQLFTSITKLVQEVSQTLSLEEDLALYVLYKSKWSKQKVYETYFQNQAYHYQHKNQQLKKIQSQYQQIQLCEICFQWSNKILRNPLCQHKYCQQCWNSHIQQQLKSGTIFFQCMNKCSQCPVLLYNFVDQHFPHLIELYIKMICINFAKFNKSISHCLASVQVCDSFSQIFDHLHVHTIQCTCATYYCFACQKQPHYPAPCSDLHKWHILLNNQSNNTLWIHNNTVQCPSCGVSVQKYIGCSYIKCVCGDQFCYNCSSYWDEQHQLNKGECTKTVQKKYNFENDHHSKQTFINFLARIEVINELILKNKQILSTSLKNTINFEKSKETKKQIMQALYGYKWSLISLFLYNKDEVDKFIQNQLIFGIDRLVHQIQKLKDLDENCHKKQLIDVENQIIEYRQNLKKSFNFWIDAWRNC